VLLRKSAVRSLDATHLALLAALLGDPVMAGGMGHLQLLPQRVSERTRQGGRGRGFREIRILPLTCAEEHRTVRLQSLLGLLDSFQRLSILVAPLHSRMARQPRELHALVWLRRQSAP
jgi:hypothetical protein